jgi:hypothetical protein
VRTQRFGTAGAVLSTVGLILVGISVWASVEARAPRAEIKPPDDTALQRLIQDGDAKTLAAVKEADKQLDSKIQELAQKTHEEQERVLSEVQSQILAIRTALNERPAPTPRPNNEPATRPAKKREPAR